MGPHWPGHYFCQFEKHLPQPKINSMRRIHLEITILERQYFVGFIFMISMGNVKKGTKFHDSGVSRLKKP